MQKGRREYAITVCTLYKINTHARTQANMHSKKSHCIQQIICNNHLKQAISIQRLVDRSTLLREAAEGAAMLSS